MRKYLVCQSRVHGRRLDNPLFPFCGMLYIAINFINWGNPGKRINEEWIQETIEQGDRELLHNVDLVIVRILFCGQKPHSQGTGHLIGIGVANNSLVKEKNDSKWMLIENFFGRFYYPIKKYVVPKYAKQNLTTIRFNSCTCTCELIKSPWWQ